MKLVKEVQIPCLLNLSACYLKMKLSYENAIIHCTDVLNIDPENAKALYRRGLAHTELANFDEAAKDLKEARTIEPNNTSIFEAQNDLRKRINEYKEKTKKIARKVIEQPKDIKQASAPQASFWTIIGKSIFDCCKRRAR